MSEWIITNCESVGNRHDICQDHTEYMVSNTVYVGSLADGVSSNKYSDIGATAVTKIACLEMCENFKKYYSGSYTRADFVHTIQNQMECQYGKTHDLKQMKSTLLLCAISKKKFILGHIGDGAILCFGKDSYVISPPQKNKVGGTATYTILDYNADENFEFITGTIDDFDGFLLTSDGLLGNVYYSGVDIPQLAYELFGSVYKETSPVEKAKRDAQFKVFLSEHIQKGDSLADDCSLFMIARDKPTGYVDYNDVSNGFEADVKWPCKCGNQNRMDEIRCSNCRTMYTMLYSPAIIKINSKESFFSKFSKWLKSGSLKVFDPTNTAEIIDAKGFAKLCEELRDSAESLGQMADIDTGKSHVESSCINANDTAPYNSSFEDSNKTAPVIDTDTSSAISGFFTKIGKAANKVTRALSKQASKFSETISTAVESNGATVEDRKSAVEPKAVAVEINNATFDSINDEKVAENRDNSNLKPLLPISLTYNEFTEAALQLGRVPMLFSNTDEPCSLSQKQKSVVDTVFSYAAYLDYFQSGDSSVFHLYCVPCCAVTIFDDRKAVYACAITKSADELLKDDMFLPRRYFQEKLRNCKEINANTFDYDKTVVSWNWYSTYLDYKANGSKMLQGFYNILKEKGFTLERPLSDIMIVAGDRTKSEFVSYLLTNDNLIRLQSVGIDYVVMEQVSLEDSYALQLRDKYLLNP